MAKILIVDDSIVLRMGVVRCLSASQHTVEEAVDGIDGWEKAKLDLSIDLFIVDMNMPGLNGLELSRKLREHESHKSKPIFMLTTESNPQLVLKGREVGVSAWIVKPFADERLAEAVSRVLTKRAA